MNKIKTIPFTNYKSSVEVFEHIAFLLIQIEENEQTKLLKKDTQRYANESQRIKEKLSPIEIGLLILCLKLRSKQTEQKAISFINSFGYSELNNRDKAKIENRVIKIYSKYVK